MSEQEYQPRRDEPTSPYMTTPSTPPPPPVTAPRPTARPATLSRRGLLIGVGAVGVSAAALTAGLLYAHGNLHLGATTVTPAAEGQIAHLLRRAGFSAQYGDLQTYQALGYTGAVDRLLDFSGANAIDAKLSSLNLDLTKIADQQRWWLLRMLYTQHPFQEKMTLFWHGLLTSSYQKVGGMTGYSYIINQNRFLRANALDTYDNILLGITQDPAMMWWLDLRLSRKTAPNENYARELMELFTLGVSGGYTQQDVHEAARALTGFQLTKGGQVSYDPAQHDSGQKTLLGQTGHLDYKDVIRIVAGHPATGPFLCKRIFAFFAHETPSDADVQPLVDAYNQSGHSMKAVMKALFESAAFQAATAYRARLKSPPEFVIGALRQLELEVSGQGIAPLLAQMGQTIFAPPNVAGWSGDQSSADWLNTSTWISRVNVINNLLFGGGGKNSAPVTDTALQQIITQRNLHTPDDAVNHYVGLLLDGQLPADRKAALTASMTKFGGQTVSPAALRILLYLIMASPEYQLN